MVLRLLLVFCLVLAASPVRGGMRIGVVVPRMQDMLWTTYLSFMERGAEELHIDLEERDAHGERLGMLGHAQGLLDMGVDGLIFSPCCGVGPEIVQRAHEAGIPVVATMEPLPGLVPGEPREYVSWVGGDYAAAAALTFKGLVESAPRASDGNVHVLVVEPGPDAIGRDERLRGMEQALEETPGAVLVGRVQARDLRSVLPDILQQWRELGAVWGGDAYGAAGVAQALREQGLGPGSDVMISAMDLEPDNVYGLRSGSILIDAGGQWMSGGYALVLLHDFILDGRIAAGQSAPFSLLPVTEKIVSIYENNYPQGLPSFDFNAVSDAHRNGEPVVKGLQRDY